MGVTVITSVMIEKLIILLEVSRCCNDVGKIQAIKKNNQMF